MGEKPDDERRSPVAGRRQRQRSRSRLHIRKYYIELAFLKISSRRMYVLSVSIVPIDT